MIPLFVPRGVVLVGESEMFGENRREAAELLDADGFVVDHTDPSPLTLETMLALIERNRAGAPRPILVIVDAPYGDNPHGKRIVGMPYDLREPWLTVRYDAGTTVEWMMHQLQRMTAAS